MKKLNILLVLGLVGIVGRIYPSEEAEKLFKKELSEQQRLKRVQAIKTTLRLMEAIEEEKIVEVKKLLKETIQINWTKNGYKGPTALMLAVISGNREIVKLLLEHKDIDPNVSSFVRSLWPETAFSLAIGKWKYVDKSIVYLFDPVIIEMLLKAGVDINAKILYGTTPLQWAIHNKVEGLPELLIKLGAKSH